MAVVRTREPKEDRLRRELAELDEADRTRRALADGTFRRLRMKAGLSLEDVIRRYDMGNSGALSRYERGQLVPAGPNTRRLSKALRDFERMTSSMAKN